MTVSYPMKFLLVLLISAHLVPSSPVINRKHHGLYGKDQLGHPERVDGDMIIKRRHDTRRQRRLAIDEVGYRWPNGVVPYMFDNVFPVAEEFKNLTKDAIEEIENYTCIRFVERTNQSGYINITAKENGCFAMVGYLDESNTVNLAPNCNSVDTVIHEFLHSLGFLHEHNRPDRDQYIYVNLSNILEDGKKSFNKYVPGSYGDHTVHGLAYDRDSVMHYHRYAFSIYEHLAEEEKKEDMSIYWLDDYRKTLGNQYGLTPLDILRVNLYYSCPGITHPPPTTTVQITTTTTTTQSQPTKTTTQTQTTTTISTSTKSTTTPSPSPPPPTTTNSSLNDTQLNWGIDPNTSASLHALDFKIIIFLNLFTLIFASLK